MTRGELFTSESNRRRPPRKLSPETKWEILLQVTSTELTQAEAAASACGRVHRRCAPEVKHAAIAALWGAGQPLAQKKFRTDEEEQR